MKKLMLFVGIVFSISASATDVVKFTEQNQLLYPHQRAVTAVYEQLLIADKTKSLTPAANFVTQLKEHRVCISLYNRLRTLQSDPQTSAYYQQKLLLLVEHYKHLAFAGERQKYGDAHQLISAIYVVQNPFELYVDNLLLVKDDNLINTNNFCQQKTSRLTTVDIVVAEDMLRNPEHKY